MKATVARRIVISAIIAALLCFSGTIKIYTDNEEMQMTIFELLIKYDKSFFEQQSINLLNATYIGLSSLWLIVLLPLITSIPALFSYADTLNGFWRMEYIRKSKNYYRIKKYFTICIYGAISAVLGYLIYIISLIPLIPYGYSLDTTDENGTPIVEYTGLPIKEFISKVSLNMLTLFLVAFITCAFSLCIYIIFKNRYKAVGVPLIIYYLSYAVTLGIYTKHVRGFGLLILSPYFIVSAGESIMEALQIPYVYLFIGLAMLIGVFYTLYYFLLNRRLEQ